MPDIKDAKKQIDIVTKKARVHLYKPIQIAEILMYHRKNPTFDLDDLESYRNASKKWRDQISQTLVGRICTSSARFQDNLFETNAMPPSFIAILGQENEKSDRAGIVEAYIYKSLGARLGSLKVIAEYLINATPATFDLSQFIENFIADPGLKRSIDKAYEITVYALFDTLVRNLKAKISVSIADANVELIKDFEDFTEMVLGVNSRTPTITIPAKLYRVGVTNAADRGLDIWANFGPAIQVKHLSLTEEVAVDIVDQVAADKILIICKNAEKDIISKILKQIGFGERIQGIITQNDLERWYKKCFSSKHQTTLGKSLLKDLYSEFISEFPSTGDALRDFIKERGYDKVEGKGPFGTV